MAQQAVARKPVLIFGAGISGLTLAQGLRRADIPFIVFEKDLAFESRSQGYRFGLAEPGVVALQSTLPTDLFDKFKRTCSTVVPKGPPGTLQAVAGREGVNPFAKSFAAQGKPGGPHAGHGEKKKPAPPIKVDRRTLRAILLQGLEAQTRFGKAFQSFKETDDGVDVTLTDGTTVSGSVLVGADGGWSKIRQQMHPDFTLRDCETRPLLGKTPLTPQLLESVDSTLLQNMTFVTGPDFNGISDVMRFDRSVDEEAPLDYIFWVLFLKPENYADEKAIEAAAKDPESAMSFARKATEDWHPSIRALFEQPETGASQLQNCTGTPGQLISNPNPFSRVTLIGDSAHPMAPTGGMGASTALKDAALLAQLLHQEGTTSETLRQYEKEMISYAQQAYQMTLVGGRAIFGFKDYEDMPVVRLH